MYPLSLLGPVGPGAENDRDDVVGLAAGLLSLGHDQAAESADTGEWTAALENEMRNFQRTHGLTIDGLARPGGETERSLNEYLATQPSVADEPSPAPRNNFFRASRRPISGMCARIGMGKAAALSPTGMIRMIASRRLARTRSRSCALKSSNRAIVFPAPTPAASYLLTESVNVSALIRSPEIRFGYNPSSKIRRGLFLCPRARRQVRTTVR